MESTGNIRRNPMAQTFQPSLIEHAGKSGLACRGLERRALAQSAGRGHPVSQALEVGLGPLQLASGLGGVSPARRESPELDAGEGGGPPVSGALLGP
jgi:hypothetical protein